MVIMFVIFALPGAPALHLVLRVAAEAPGALSVLGCQVVPGAASQTPVQGSS